MAKTKEERYILNLYNTAKKSGDVFSLFNKYEIGKAIGFNPNSIDGICRTLAQANFIKVQDKTTIKLSHNGLELIETLLGK